MKIEFDIKKIILSQKNAINKEFIGNFSEGITHITGNNGSGKTSLLKSLVGIYNFTGSCKIAGTCIKHSPIAYKSHIGFCPDSYTFTESISPGEYLNFVCMSYGIENPDIEDATKEIGLHHFLDQKIKNLSYGNRKKLLLVASTINTPNVWIMDEPVNGLDNQGKEWLENYISKRSRNGITLLTCHNTWIDKFKHNEYHIR